jgi:hypothetical protein
MPSSTPSAIRKQIETKLRDIVWSRHQLWKSARTDKQAITRQRFLNALNAFDALVLHGKLPGSREPHRN